MIDRCHRNPAPQPAPCLKTADGCKADWTKARHLPRRGELPVWRQRVNVHVLDHQSSMIWLRIPRTVPAKPARRPRAKPLPVLCSPAALAAKLDYRQSSMVNRQWFNSASHSLRYHRAARANLKIVPRTSYIVHGLPRLRNPHSTIPARSTRCFQNSAPHSLRILAALAAELDYRQSSIVNRQCLGFYMACLGFANHTAASLLNPRLASKFRFAFASQLTRGARKNENRTSYIVHRTSYIVHRTCFAVQN